MKDQTEVSLLSHGVLFFEEDNPYPIYYRWAFACSVLPYPPHCRRALQHAFPGGSTTGLPSSACVTEWVRLSLSTGGVACPCHGTYHPVSPPRFGGISIFASGLVNDVYREFACASHTIHPSPVPRDARRDALASRLPRQLDSCGYIVRGQSPGRYLPASPPRVLMMGHQVQSQRAVLDNYLGDFLSHNMEPIQNTFKGRALRLDGCHHRPAIRCPICQRRHPRGLREALLFRRIDQRRFERV